MAASKNEWEQDFDFTATGHYATTVQRDGKTWLGTARDPLKDQTDFLAQIDYLQVSKLLFPVGNLMKHEVRDVALRAGLPSARRKDSQGICFLGKINYNDFVRRFLGECEGAIIELETGKRVGTHRGVLVSYHRSAQRTRIEWRPVVRYSQKYRREYCLRFPWLRCRYTVRLRVPHARLSFHYRKILGSDKQARWV